MAVAACAESFTAFLLDCVARSESGRRSFVYEQTIGGKAVTLAATLLPPSVRTPLWEVAGPLTCPTVLLTRPGQAEVREEKEEEESPELKPILDQFSHSFLEDLNKEENAQEDTVKKENGASVPLLQEEVVYVGPKPSRCRSFLKQDIPFHPGLSHAVIKHAVLKWVRPLSLDLTRAFVSYYLVGARLRESALPAIWVPCTQTEGAVPEDIVGMGCTNEAKDSMLRVYCVREREVVSGGVRRESVRFKPQDLQGNAFARYVVTSSETDSTVCGGGVGRVEISIEFSWDDPETFLCPPPTFGTEGVLHIAVEPGGLQASVKMFAELGSLLEMCEAVSEEREWWGELSETEEVLEQRREPLHIDGVDDFLQNIDTHLSEVDVISPSLESTIFQRRENYDFSEKLWLFLKDVRSPSDLQAALAAIFKAVLLRRIQNIGCRKDSKSPLAPLLGELVRCKSDAERQALAPKFQLLLSPTHSLHFLAQIGVDKVRRDITVFLVASKVASRSDVDGFFEGQQELLTECHSLCNLFHVVELVATAMSHNCLPPVSLAVLTKSALEFYRDRLPFVGFESTPQFSVALPRSSKALRPAIDMCVGSGSLSMWSIVNSKMVVATSSASVAAGVPGASRKGRVYEVTCNEVLTT